MDGDPAGRARERRKEPSMRRTWTHTPQFKSSETTGSGQEPGVVRRRCWRWQVPGSWLAGLTSGGNEMGPSGLDRYADQLETGHHRAKHRRASWPAARGAGPGIRSGGGQSCRQDAMRCFQLCCRARLLDPLTVRLVGVRRRRPEDRTNHDQGQDPNEVSHARSTIRHSVGITIAYVAAVVRPPRRL